MVEITTESYFFKQVNEKEASLIGTFRMLSPLGRVIAPTLALIILFFGSLQSLFAIYGIIILSGIFFAFRLVDTR